MRIVAVIVAAMTVVTSVGCASTLVSLGLGAERGASDLVERRSSEGVAYLERKPRAPRDVVVLVHGFGGNKDHFTRFARHLPDDLWVLALDLPGFGDSPHVATDSYDLHAQAERLARFLAEREVPRAHLVGSSMGGQLAVLHALAHPEAVASLVLLDPAGIPSPVPSAMDELTKGGTEPLLIQNAADFERLLSLSFVRRPDIPAFLLDHFAAEAARALPFARKVRDDLNARPAPLADRLAALKTPALVVWGDSDKILDPSTAALWRARVPSGLVVVMRETGHAPMLERPEETAALVLRWWQRAGVVLPPAGRGAALPAQAG